MLFCVGDQIAATLKLHSRQGAITLIAGSRGNSQLKRTSFPLPVAP